MVSLTNTLTVINHNNLLGFITNKHSLSSFMEQRFICWLQNKATIFTAKRNKKICLLVDVKRLPKN